MEVVGATVSADFPTTPGAYDRTYNGKFDAFVVILQIAPTMHVGSITPGYRPQRAGFVVGARIQIVGHARPQG